MMKNLRKDDLAKMMEEGVDGDSEPYVDSAFHHYGSYEGDWIAILIRSVFLSIVAVLFLRLSEAYLNNFVFKDILSLELFRSSSGTFVALLLAGLLLHAVQSFFDYKRVEIVRMDCLSRKTEAQYILSSYYDANNLTVLVPMLASLIYLCGGHEWYGYGFLLYVNIIIIWLMVKPVMAVLFAGWKMYQMKR